MMQFLCMRIRFLERWTHIGTIAAIFCSISFAADSAPQITLNTSKAAPRAMEPLTEKAVFRDYKFAWGNLGLALESNSPGPLNALFVGRHLDGVFLALLLEKEAR